jgi:predicted Fe-Mo cluster-binding NifX family protein
MRIAIPIWDDKISPVLDTASKLLVVEVEDQKEASRFEIYLDEHELSRRCIRIRGMDVDLLICGAISRPFYRMLIGSGINIIQDISGHPEDVLKAYLHGKLLHSGFFMPGCKGDRGKHGRRHINGSQKQNREQKNCHKGIEK